MKRELAKFIGTILNAPRKGTTQMPTSEDQTPITPVAPTVPAVVVDPQTQAKAILAAIVGVLQALNLCGLSVGAAANWLDAKQAMLMGLLSAILGVVQIVLPAVKRK